MQNRRGVSGLLQFSPPCTTSDGKGERAHSVALSELAERERGDALRLAGQELRQRDVVRNEGSDDAEGASCCRHAADNACQCTAKAMGRGGTYWGLPLNSAAARTANVVARKPKSAMNAMFLRRAAIL